jgi:hypothetical protein
MKKIVRFIAVLIIIIVGSQLISCLNYTSGGKRGYSESLQESKERGVFIKELKYQITPTNLELNPKVIFFIEKGFKYGSNSIFKTDSLIDDFSSYQLISSRCRFYCKKFKSCEYDCSKNKHFVRDTIILLENSSSPILELENGYVNDTIVYDVLYNKKGRNGISIVKVDTIGKIKVWEEH